MSAGLTPYQALAAGTSTPGTLLGTLRRGLPAGTVMVGSRADLLLLEANPLVDIAHAARIAGVMVRGDWHTRAELDRRRTR